VRNWLWRRETDGRWLSSPASCGTVTEREGNPCRTHSR
jgi:hypothetical protein